MPNTSLVAGFIVASLIVLLTPGPGVLYVVARSVAQGYRAGLASALGLSMGVFAHVAAAAIGLSALLLASTTAFTVVKAVGAGYLIYLGLKILFSRPPPESESGSTPDASTHLPLRRLFLDGVIVSVFNPKIAVFFLAFLPQFIDTAAGSVTQQIMFLGALYAVLALFTDSGYALLAGSLRRWLSGHVLNGSLPRYLNGSVYIGLGVNTALTGQRS